MIAKNHTPFQKFVKYLKAQKKAAGFKEPTTLN